MKHLQKIILGVALLLGVLVGTPALAATNLPMVCLTPAEAGKPVNIGCGGRAQTGQVYKVPADTDLVRIMTDNASQANWDSNVYAWKAWKDVKAGDYYDVCKTDVAVNSLVTAPGCTDWGMIQRGAVVTVGAGVVNFTWVAPTQNTDGTPLTDLSGFYIYQGGVRLATSLNAAARSLQLTLPEGTFVYSLSAYSPGGESAQTPTISVRVVKPVVKKIPGQPTQFKGSVTLTVP